MPIKYSEITIIINTEKETMSNYFNRILLNDENETTDNDTIIILFDDGIIYDVKKECQNKNINILIGPKYFKTNSPMFFQIKDKTFFSKTPSLGYYGLKLDFKPIFANSQKFLTSKKEPSAYNCIFERGNNETLAIVRQKSNSTKPRFLLAYDDEYFEKEDIIYFVNYIFSINLL
jgi:hypothetical protein